MNLNLSEINKYSEICKIFFQENFEYSALCAIINVQSKKKDKTIKIFEVILSLI